MTRITYTEKNDIIKISLDGHADYNPGNDPVCAAISTITYQMLNVLDDFANRGFIEDFATDIKPGLAIISFKANDIVRWKYAWDVIRIGYENIAEAYPENVVME